MPGERDADQGDVDCAGLRGSQPVLGRTDGIAVRLGRRQEVLAELGVVPGGALRPEIAVRSRYDQFEPTCVDAGERVSATHAVEEGELTAGLDRLVSPDETQSGFPTSNAVDSTWLFCPRKRGARHRFDWIGGVTWDHVGVATSPAPWLDAREADHEEARQAAAPLVVRHVLAGQRDQLVGAPEDLLERCVDEPETVRVWVA